MIIRQCTDRTKELVDNLLRLWEESVRESHEFLSEADREKLVPCVRQGIEQIETLVLAQTQQEEAAGFMGLEGEKIEMLFLSPAWFRKGVGRQMIAFAKAHCRARLVDVNEQNPKARAFYERMGFAAYARSPLDEQGNAFPILKMRLKEE